MIGSKHTQHIRGFDGLRALAVLAVIACHISDRLTGGWLGVDVFFVLSGYLITTLLLGEHERSGKIALMHFYGRRALRLYPALLIMTAVCAFWPQVFGFNGESKGYMVTAMVALTYMTDLTMYFKGTAYGDLGHTWSLSVEEHFYLLWPVLLILVLRRGWSPLLLSLTAAGSSLVLLLATASDIVFGNPVAYFAPQTRAYELLLGGAAAAAVLRFGLLHRRLAAMLLVGGSAVLLLLFALASLRPDENSMAVKIAIAGVAATGLVVGVASAQDSWFVRVLELWPFVWLGRISYGAYLYHYPILALVRHYGWAESGPQASLMAVPLILALSAMSFRFVERPIARFGRGVLAGRSPTVVDQAPTVDDVRPLETTGPAHVQIEVDEVVRLGRSVRRDAES